jgi:hypothetical protein
VDVPIRVVRRLDAVGNHVREGRALYSTNSMSARDELDHLRRREPHPCERGLVRLQCILRLGYAWRVCTRRVDTAATEINLRPATV